MTATWIFCAALVLTSFGIPAMAMTDTAFGRWLRSPL